MKSKKILTALSLLLAVFTYLSIISWSGGYIGVSSTGCGGSTCHSSGTATTSVTLTGVPTSGYVPGTLYPLTLTVSNLTKAAAGFDLSVSGGTISGAPSGTSLNGATELHHTTPKNAVSGTTSWTFNWTAPLSGSAVTFNAAGNAVNLDFASSGDAYNVGTFNHSAATTTVTPPSVISSTVTAITQNSATINASVNANGGNTSVSVDYGLTTAYGSNIATLPGNIIGTTASAVSANLSGLTPNTLYHYRIKATNAAGTTNGPDATFTTLSTSVNDIEFSDFTLYPNPASDYLLFTSKTAVNGFAVSAYSVTGSKIMLHIEKQDAAHYKLNTEHLSPGFYIMHLRVNEKEYQYSFVKK